MSTPSDCKFTKEHEWGKPDGSRVKVGISEYAQQELGDVVFVELPAIGREVKRGESVSSVESVKAVSDIYAPLDGKVVEVNDTLSSNPEKLNESPYEDGWMLVLEISNPEQLSELMSAEDYDSFVSEISK